MDESKMPRGHCRYILLQPEIRGHRCACVGFSLKQGIPSATCDCGHLACYHNKDLEPSSDHKQELDILKRRIQQLEDRLMTSQEDARDGLADRLNEVEDHLEKSREEFAEQIKGAYRNVSINWRSIEQVEHRNNQQAEQIHQILHKLSAHDQQLDRLQAGQLELRDADLSLEERIESLTETLEENEELFLSRHKERQPRRRSTSDSSHPNLTLGPLGPLSEGVATLNNSWRPRQAPQACHREVERGAGFAHDGMPVSRAQRPVPVSAPSTGAWTVHISLLPHAFVAMPFERDTNAYQRCLSRGLHKMVAVHGPDAASFTEAVEKAFGSFLRGREWMPLQAKLCDAKQLQGLPMLRQLEPHLIEEQYDHEFLREHCAVCDNSGMIDSLYIAMRCHTISWHTLRHSPVFMEGLEDSWTYDALLDTDPFDGDMAVDDGHRPAAGDITTALPPLPQSLKRPLAEISRSDGLASAAAVDGDEARVKRTCPVSSSKIVEIRRRGVETA